MHQLLELLRSLPFAKVYLDRTSRPKRYLWEVPAPNIGVPEQTYQLA